MSGSISLPHGSNATARYATRLVTGNINGSKAGAFAEMKAADFASVDLLGGKQGPGPMTNTRLASGGSRGCPHPGHVLPRNQAPAADGSTPRGANRCRQTDHSGQTLQTGEPHGGGIGYDHGHSQFAGIPMGGFHHTTSGRVATVAVVLLLAGTWIGPEARAAPVAVPPRNTGPEATSHTRTRRHGRSTKRVIRRTPAVMQEDAARVSRGDLFSTWSNRYLE